MKSIKCNTLKSALIAKGINCIFTDKIEQIGRVEWKENSPFYYLQLCYKYFMVQEDFCNETNGPKNLLFAYSPETSPALTTQMFSSMMNCKSF